jgi:hypothetical protein
MSSTFVLVHGAWQTAATWDLVAPELRRRGCRVYCAKLTGLEEDPRELTADVTLDTANRNPSSSRTRRWRPSAARAWHCCPLLFYSS